jgi:DNA gyrase subunit B
MSYDESSIKHFEGLDGVRRKPGMYLGERGDAMVFQGVKELVDNVVDEYFAGRNKSLFVSADTKKNIYLVADAAQGIPVGKHPEAKISTLTLIFTKLHAGGKFDDKAYKFSGGTHGVGAAATNAVAKTFKVWTYRDRAWHHQAFTKGKPNAAVRKSVPPMSVWKQLGKKLAKGTLVWFEPDPEVVNANSKQVARLPVPRTTEWLRDVSDLNKGLQITLRVNGRTKKFVNEVGISKLLEDHNKKFSLDAVGKPFIMNHELMDIAVQWTSYPEQDGIKSFVSSSRTRDGGTHLDGLYGAITKVLTAHKLKTDKFTPKDLRFGLVGYINVRLSGADFSGQTKDRLVSDVAKQVEKEALAGLTEFFDKNKPLARRIIKRACETKKSQEQFKKVLAALSKVKKGAKGAMLPGVLTVAKDCKPEDRELYIVEGGSAEGTAVDARDVDFQEILPLKGKPPNALRTAPDRLLANEPVQNILISLGVDVKSLKPGSLRVNVDSLRVRRIMLLSDADPDGRHINVLLLTLFWRLMPDMFHQGRIFVVDAPLFFGFWKNKHYYGASFEECYSQMKGAPKSAVTRAKGWGEINSEPLEMVAFAPKTRTAIQIDAPSDSDATQWFEAIVGEGTEARKQLLGL